MILKNQPAQAVCIILIEQNAVAFVLDELCDPFHPAADHHLAGGHSLEDDDRTSLGVRRQYDKLASLYERVYGLPLLLAQEADPFCEAQFVSQLPQGRFERPYAGYEKIQAWRSRCDLAKGSNQTIDTLHWLQAPREKDIGPSRWIAGLFPDAVGIDRVWYYKDFPSRERLKCDSFLPQLF